MTTAEKGVASDGPGRELGAGSYDLKTIQLLQHAAALGLTREEILGIPVDGPSNVASLDDRRKLHEHPTLPEQPAVTDADTLPVSGETA